MSMIVTRTSGIEDAGILMIAFAVGNLVMMIGKYGMHAFQVTDIKREYSTSAYLYSRIVTVLTMLLATTGYLFYASAFLSYSLRKSLIVSMIVAIYAVESVEDLIWGYYQREGFLYIAARMFCFRWLGAQISFAIGMLCGMDIVQALALAFLSSLIIFLTLIFFQFKGQRERILQAFRIGKGFFSEWFSLMFRVFPLFGASFLSFYLNNSPKYAIDAELNDGVQACYSFVAMPVFVVGLLNSFIYQPTLVSLTEAFHRKDRTEYHHRVRRQFGILLMISIVCAVGAAVIGIPVLSWLYQTDLTGYWRELVILQVAGGFLAISGYQIALLTIMRRQQLLLLGYGLVSLIALFSMSTVVRQFGTLGAAWDYLILMVMLSVVYGISYFWSLRKAVHDDVAE